MLLLAIENDNRHHKISLSLSLSLSLNLLVKQHFTNMLCSCGYLLYDAYDEQHNIVVHLTIIVTLWI